MSTTNLSAYTWEQQPAAAELVQNLLEKFRRGSPEIKRLGQRLRDETGTRLLDWIDSLFLSSEQDLPQRLENVGFRPAEEEDVCVWQHPEGIFPSIFCGAPFFVDATGADVLTIKVDCVDDFSRVHANSAAVCRGKSGSPLRTTLLPASDGPRLAAIERHGWRKLTWPTVTDRQIAQAAKYCQAFAQRTRDCGADASGFQLAAALIGVAARDLGADWACDLFFAAERHDWMSRNHAARVQYDRQQKLGLGWANHDHHTYRSSRASFQNLVSVLEQLGFHCRERFYAGQEAGWGAQVLEQPQAGLVVFADVDLSPEEVHGDFAHEPLPSRDELGTVGLWCALHGVSFLQAGLHHLECQFDFDAAREQLRSAGVETMAPFTDFSFLRQAFTAGEMWAVDPERIEKTLASGAITAEQAEQFRSVGALGSHLEILERNDGYKGFNQTGVSDIIARTDPRNA